MILEGRLVDHEKGVRHGQVQIAQGRIARVGDRLGRSDFSFGPECLIFPGFGDLHVHLRWGQPHKETFETGVQAALNGGVCFMLDMPNNPDPPVTAEGLAAKRRAAGEWPVLIDFYAGVGPDTRPIDGHPFYKAYVAASIGPLFFENEEQLDVLRHYKGKRITFHCEDPALLEASKAAKEHEDRRPPAAEVQAIETVLRLSARYGFQAHIAHLSTAEGHRKLKGRALCEVAPHHLYFDRENRKKAQRNEFLKMNPPLRTPGDRQYLLESFKAGEIDFLATDHAPHTVEEKASDNPSGVPLLDTYGGFVTWLLHHGVTPERAARHCSHNPAEFGGWIMGRILPGYAAHLTVLNMTSPWTVRAEEMRTKCGWSPFEGETFPGRVELTVASGRPFKNGLDL